MAENTGRTLLLFRHAKSAWPDVADHDRPLAGRGQRDAPAMGRWLREAGCAPDLVLCSTALRARETWRLAQEALGADPPVRFESRLYGASAAGLLDLARQAPAAVRTLLLIGHNPAIQDLALLLATPGPGGIAAGEPGAVERARAKFPTAAIAALHLAQPWPELAPGTARLSRFVIPRGLPAA
jgi:phosphohistidine phosphatase